MSAMNNAYILLIQEKYMVKNILTCAFFEQSS
jgi:hypothetical protein